MNPYLNQPDTWEKTEAALRVANMAFIALHEPKDKDEAALNEVRAFAVQIHYRRIALNLAERKKRGYPYS